MVKHYRRRRDDVSYFFYYMKRLLIAILLLLCLSSEAQHDRRFGLSAQYDYGLILHTNDFLRGENAHNQSMNSFMSYTLLADFRTTGAEDWEHIHNFPSFGVGLYTATFENSSEIGQPISVFGYYKGLFWRGRSTALKYNLDLGLATNWKNFDAENNPYNISIGTPLTVHIGLGIEVSQLISKHWEVSAGVAFTHFSNGSTIKPNKGLNLLSPHIRLAYLFNPVDLPERKFFDREPQNELQITVSAGVKSVEIDQEDLPELLNNYPKGTGSLASSLQLAIMHRYAHKGKFGGGVSLIYDGSRRGGVELVDPTRVKLVRATAKERFDFGIFAQHDLCIDRITVIAQVGAEILQFTSSAFGEIQDFERLGVRYTFGNNLFAGVNIYAHQMQLSDFIEWNVGYAIRLKKRATP